MLVALGATPNGVQAECSAQSSSLVVAKDVVTDRPRAPRLVTCSFNENVRPLGGSGGGIVMVLSRLFRKTAVVEVFTLTGL